MHGVDEARAAPLQGEEAEGLVELLHTAPHLLQAHDESGVVSEVALPRRTRRQLRNRCRGVGDGHCAQVEALLRHGAGAGCGKPHGGHLPRDASPVVRVEVLVGHRRHGAAQALRHLLPGKHEALRQAPGRVVELVVPVAVREDGQERGGTGEESVGQRRCRGIQHGHPVHAVPHLQVPHQHRQVRSQGIPLPVRRRELAEWLVDDHVAGVGDAALVVQVLVRARQQQVHLRGRAARRWQHRGCWLGRGHLREQRLRGPPVAEAAAQVPAEGRGELQPQLGEEEEAGHRRQVGDARGGGGAEEAGPGPEHPLDDARGPGQPAPRLGGLLRVPAEAGDREQRLPQGPPEHGAAEVERRVHVRPLLHVSGVQLLEPVGVAEVAEDGVAAAHHRASPGVEEGHLARERVGAGALELHAAAGREALRARQGHQDPQGEGLDAAHRAAEHEPPARRQHEARAGGAVLAHPSALHVPELPPAGDVVDDAEAAVALCDDHRIRAGCREAREVRGHCPRRLHVRGHHQVQAGSDREVRNGRHPAATDEALGIRQEGGREVAQCRAQPKLPLVDALEIPGEAHGRVRDLLQRRVEAPEAIL
mmetsp:Transcript_122845/g.348198  ORF Transcript_122845/g.348198 Transcript_122845/m.348198 type:complete len:592 (+) Transcript_122845:195-1970(+)